MILNWKKLSVSILVLTVMLFVGVLAINKQVACCATVTQNKLAVQWFADPKPVSLDTIIDAKELELVNKIANTIQDENEQTRNVEYAQGAIKERSIIYDTGIVKSPVKYKNFHYYVVAYNLGETSNFWSGVVRVLHNPQNHRGVFLSQASQFNIKPNWGGAGDVILKKFWTTVYTQDKTIKPPYTTIPSIRIPGSRLALQLIADNILYDPIPNFINNKVTIEPRKKILTATDNRAVWQGGYHDYDEVTDNNYVDKKVVGNYIYRELEDFTRVYYKLSLAPLTVKPNIVTVNKFVPNIKFINKKQNKAEYWSPGVYSKKELEVKVGFDNLHLVGQTPRGDRFYEPKNIDVIEKKYQRFWAGVEENRTMINEYNADHHPVLYWQDVLGLWHEFFIKNVDEPRGYQG